MSSPSYEDWTKVATWDVTKTDGNPHNLTDTHDLAFEDSGGKNVKIKSPAGSWATGVTYLVIDSTGTTDPVDKVEGRLSDNRTFVIKRSIHGARPQLDCTIEPVRTGESPTDGGTWTAQEGSGGSGVEGGCGGRRPRPGKRPRRARPQRG